MKLLAQLAQMFAAIDANNLCVLSPIPGVFRDWEVQARDEDGMPQTIGSGPNLSAAMREAMATLNHLKGVK
jgi:hypothetical protein